MLLKITNRIFHHTRRNLAVRVRFAPSPTGRMHIGGLRIAFYNYLFAKKHKGEFLLRIEDTDRQRFRADSVDNIISSLKWTNLIADHGVGFSKSEEEAREYFQSNRLKYYKTFVGKLIDRNLAYKCYCSEMRLELMKKNAIKNEEKQSYDGKCRHLTQKQIIEMGDKPYVVRFKLEHETVKFNDLIYGECVYNLHEQEGDFVLLKSDGYPTYHFANIVDDHLMGITHVLRGQEWLTSTPKHLMLYKALNLEPPQYAHFPLIMNPDGTKLSKRNNDIDVMSFKNRSYLPEALLGYLTTFGGGFRNEGQNIETKSLNELVDLFDLNFIVKRPIKFSEEALLSTNKDVLEKKVKSNDKALIVELRNLLIQKYNDIDSHYLTDSYLSLTLSLTMFRISKLSDLLADAFQFLWYKIDKTVLENTIKENIGLERNQIVYLINEFTMFIQNYELSGNEAGSKKFKEDLTKEFALNKYKKINLIDSAGKKLNFWLFYRVILSGSKSGPPIAEIINLLGKNNILHRLNYIKDVFLNE